MYLALARDPEFGENAWVLPKGHVRSGETLVNTAVRETYEEVGARNFRVLAYLGQVERYSIQDWGERVWKTIHLFLAVALSGDQLKPDPDETLTDAAWLPIREAIECIPWAEEREFLSRTLRPLLS